jgi:glycosyltransferase involved in cell wall biosynthesis
VPIRVLYLHHVEQLAGAETSLRLLLRHLDRARVTPIFGGPDAGPFPERLVQDGIEICPLHFARVRSIPRLLGTVSRLRALLKGRAIHLVHANGPQTNVPAGMAGRLSGVPVIWHARNLLYGRMTDIDRHLSFLANRIVCNSDAIRERFRRSPAWDKSVTIPTGVDTREFSPALPREPFRRIVGVGPTEPLVGIVGRIGLGKGHDIFVEAAVRLLQESCPARFIIVGDTLAPEDGQRVDALRRRVRSAGFQDRILFTGFRTDIPSVMRGLDILVLASEAEPFGRVLLEAMASGTAIVATDSGGTPEMVRNEREGLLVPPRDCTALTAAIRRLASDPALRAALGRAGVARARDRYSIDSCMRELLAVYETALRSG